MKKRIGDILMEMGFIDGDQLQMALLETKKTGIMLGDVLLRLGWVTEEDLQMAIAVQSGAKILVTSCAECLRTWKIDYARFFQGPLPRILHITEFLAEHQSELKLEENGKHRVVFQDPCRLGRHLGIYDPPRKVLSAVPGIELVEMRHSGPAAICCAGGTWSNCDRFAKKIQVERLREARATDAEVLVTACPKCQVHFRCTMKDPNLSGEIGIEMRDVAQLVAESVFREKASEGTES